MVLLEIYFTACLPSTTCLPTPVQWLNVVGILKQIPSRIHKTLLTNFDSQLTNGFAEPTLNSIQHSLLLSFIYITVWQLFHPSLVPSLFLFVQTFQGLLQIRSDLSSIPGDPKHFHALLLCPLFKGECTGARQKKKWSFSESLAHSKPTGSADSFCGHFLIPEHRNGIGILGSRSHPRLSPWSME